MLGLCGFSGFNLETTEHSWYPKKIGGRDMDYRVGDIVKLKKPHPCGCDEFALLRVGMDFKLRCRGCGREIMVPRHQAEKSIRAIVQREEE